MPPTHKAPPTLTTAMPPYVDSATSDLAPTLTTAMPLSVDPATFGLHISNIPKTHKILYPLKQAPGENAKWAGMTPLEMVAYIMSLAEGSATPQSNGQLQFGRSSMQNFPSDGPNRSTAQQIGAKRKRDCTEEDEYDIFNNDRCDDDEADAIVMTCMQPVDDSFVNKWTPSSYVGESSHSVNLNLLVREFERVAVDPTKKWCLPSYNRVQQAFHSKIGVAGGNEKHDLAVSEASTQMKALIEMASHDIKEASKPSFSPKIAAACRPMAKSAAETFQHTMNFWVKHNWRNPFPDDTMLLHLSHFIIENRSVPLNSKDVTTLAGADPTHYDGTMVNIATEKITNWLVNCRTRKWRPSIERAFDLRRPVALLTEDSIRLYEGLDVRPIVGWDADLLFSFDPKFLTKLKMWKKEGRAGRTKMVKATKRRPRNVGKKGSNLETSYELSPGHDDINMAVGFECDIEAV